MATLYTYVAPSAAVIYGGRLAPEPPDDSPAIATLAGTNLTALNPCPSGTCDYTNGRTLDSLITSWCATPPIRIPGKEGWAAFGGGHAGWAGNDAYRFDIAGTNPAAWGWTRVSEPTTPLFASTADALNPPTSDKDYRADAEYGEYYNSADALTVYGGGALTDSAGTEGIAGALSAAHTYNEVCHIPPGTILGDDPRGYLYSRTRSRMMTAQASGGGWSHYLGLSNDGLATYWMRGTKAWASISGYGCTAYDPMRSLVLGMGAADAGGKSSMLAWHDLTDDTFSSGNLVNPAGGTAPRPEIGYSQMFYWASEDLYIKAGGNSSGWDIVLIEPVTRKAWFVTTAFPRPGVGTWEWVESKRLLVWYGGTRDVYVLTPPADPIADAWPWEKITLVGGDEPFNDPVHPPWQRFLYWPHLDKFTWCAEGKSNVQVIKVAGL